MPMPARAARDDAPTFKPIELLVLTMLSGGDRHGYGHVERDAGAA